VKKAHPPLIGILTGLHYLSGDIEHPGLGHKNGIAVPYLDIPGLFFHVSFTLEHVSNLYPDDLAVFNLFRKQGSASLIAFFRSHNHDFMVCLRKQPSCHRKGFHHIHPSGEGIGAGHLNLSHYGDFAAFIAFNNNAYLGVYDIILIEKLPDLFFYLNGGQAAHRDLTNQRKTDFPLKVDPYLSRKVRMVPDSDGYLVFRAYDIVILGRCFCKKSNNKKQSETKNICKEFFLHN